jgi:drug/metabolite transporter (DMT)-like permease
MFSFSINDVGIKFISDDYALHEIVMIRSVTAIIFMYVLFVPFTKNFTLFKTKRLGMHLLRGLCIAVSNMFYFLGLSALTLAEATAIFFVSPLLITVFSVVFLKETAGIHRWGAVIVGFIGVLVIIRPGNGGFVFASLYPIGAAMGYAALHMITRKIGRSESGLTLSFYIQFTFVLVCIAFGLAIGDGRYAGQDDPSLEFLFRPWGPIAPEHWPILAIVAASAASAGYFISQAYRIAQAALVAPFEYVALPLSVFWGFVIFSDIPDLTTFLGMALILASGLYVIWRTNVRKVHKGKTAPRIRR